MKEAASNRLLPDQHRLAFDRKIIERPDASLQALAQAEVERLRGRVKEMEAESLSLREKASRLQLEGRRQQHQTEREKLEAVRQAESQCELRVLEVRQECAREIQLMASHDQELVYQLEMEKQDILKELQLRGQLADRLKVQLESLTLAQAQSKQTIARLDQEVRQLSSQKLTLRSRAEQLQLQRRTVQQQCERRVEEEARARKKQREQFIRQLEDIQVLQANELQQQRLQSENRVMLLEKKFQELAAGSEASSRAYQKTNQLLQEELSEYRHQLAQKTNLLQSQKSQLMRGEQQNDLLARENLRQKEEISDCKQLLLQSQLRVQSLIDRQFQSQDELARLQSRVLEGEAQLERCRNTLNKSEFELARLREDSERERGRLLLIVEEREIEAHRWRESYFSLKSQL